MPPLVAAAGAVGSLLSAAAPTLLTTGVGYLAKNALQNAESSEARNLMNQQSAIAKKQRLAVLLSPKNYYQSGYDTGASLANNLGYFNRPYGSYSYGGNQGGLSW